MEQIMVKASRPMQMMKALLLSYVATGVLLLGLAFLLYKTGIGRESGKPGDHDNLHIILSGRGILYGQERKDQALPVGNGTGIGICRFSLGGDLSYGKVRRGSERNHTHVFYLHLRRGTGRNAVIGNSAPWLNCYKRNTCLAQRAML